MSNFSTVYDVLSHNQKLHARIAEFYRELSADSSDERVKMLLNVLIKHELQLMASLRDYIEEASAKILETFFQFDREQSVEPLFSKELVHKQISDDNVELIANRFDQYFVELYAQMLEAVDCVEVQELFENLRQHMEQEKKRLSTDINAMKDM